MLVLPGLLGLVFSKMRFVTRAIAFVALFVLAVSACASHLVSLHACYDSLTMLSAPLESTEPEIVIEASFPEQNPFGRMSPMDTHLTLL